MARFNLKNLFAAQKMPVKPPMQEQGRTIIGVMGAGRPMPVITDDLVDRKGSAIYREMTHDSEVKNGLRILAGSLLIAGWEIHPNSNKEAIDQAAEQADFVTQALNNMPGSFDTVVDELVRSALVFGTGIAEINYELSDGKIALASIKGKSSDEYLFELDEYNNLVSLVVNVMGRRAPVDICKFIIFANESQEGQPRGQSALRACYRWWWLKNEMSKSWSFYLDKFGIPTARGRYKQNTPKSEQDEMITVLDKIQRETVLTFPDNWEVDLMTADQVISGGGFKEIIGYCDAQITKCLLGQTLTTGEGSRTGSMALGNVHADILGTIIANLRRKVEETIDEQLVRRLIDFNFATPLYPNFTLPIDSKNTAILTDTIFKLISCEAVDARESWIREYIGLPAREELAAEQATQH